MAPVEQVCENPPARSREDQEHDRLAIVLVDLVSEASTPTRYRVLARLSRPALLELLAAAKLERLVTEGGCEWCWCTGHDFAECPDLPVDLALALYEP